MDRTRDQPRQQQQRLPRADGDGPSRTARSRSFSSAPPCRRGWTRQVPGRVSPPAGSPVQTGMDRYLCPLSSSSMRLPRADGDGPIMTGLDRPVDGAPPCRRGWTPSARRAVPRLRGSPVQTGMDPPRIHAANSARGLPRADGDGPPPYGPRGESLEAPPCRRGWTAGWRARRRAPPGSPVQTGMDPSGRRPPRRSRRLPRADGDGPRPIDPSLPYGVAPPCRRGWTREPREHDPVHLGSPVQTGMDPHYGPAVVIETGLPRADGDGPPPLTPSPTAALAPPCRRGWTVERPRRAARGRGSPVQTGMDRSGDHFSITPRGLPRADGDGPPRALELLRGEAAPPCRRGWTR